MSQFLPPVAGVMVAVWYMLIAEITPAMPDHIGFAFALGGVVMFGWLFSPLPDGHTLGRSHGGGYWGFSPPEDGDRP